MPNARFDKVFGAEIPMDCTRVLAWPNMTCCIFGSSILQTAGPVKPRHGTSKLVFNAVMDFFQAIKTFSSFFSESCFLRVLVSVQ